MLINGNTTSPLRLADVYTKLKQITRKAGSTLTASFGCI